MKILLDHGSNIHLQTKVLISFFFFPPSFLFIVDNFLVVSDMMGKMVGSFLKLFFVKSGWIALHYAAEKGSEEIVKILIEHGSNVNLQDEVLFFSLFLFSFCYHFLLLNCDFLTFFCFLRVVKQSLMLQKMRKLLN